MTSLTLYCSTDDFALPINRSTVKVMFISNQANLHHAVHDKLMKRLPTVYKNAISLY